MSYTPHPLAYQFAACKHFRWTVGMQVHCAEQWSHLCIVIQEAERGVSAQMVVICPNDEARIYPVPADAIPCVEHPGTFGCILGLLRRLYRTDITVKRWPSANVDMSGRDRGWYEVVDTKASRVVQGPWVQHPTQLAAALHALQHAPNDDGGWYADLVSKGSISKRWPGSTDAGWLGFLCYIIQLLSPDLARHVQRYAEAVDDVLQWPTPPAGGLGESGQTVCLTWTGDRHTFSLEIWSSGLVEAFWQEHDSTRFGGSDKPEAFEAAVAGDSLAALERLKGDGPTRKAS